jgi:hypothetical protein
VLNPPTPNRDSKRENSSKETESPSDLPFCPMLPMSNPIEDQCKTSERNGKMHGDWVKDQDTISFEVQGSKSNVKKFQVSSSALYF